MIKKTLFSLVILLTGLLVIGCSQPASPEVGDDDSPVILGESSDANTGLEGISEFQIVIPANDLGKGTPRIPFIIMDGGRMVSEEVDAVFITVFDLSGSEPTPIWEGPATNYSDYTVPYWVFYPTIETVGNFGMRADLLTADGDSTQAQFAVAIQEDAVAPNVGDAAVPSQSPVGSGDELAAISSDQNPDEDLYQISLEDAFSSGLPTIISFSTPAYCQTAICAPVLESIKQFKDENEDNANFVHVEIFGDFETFETAATIKEWQLQSEPWTYLVDKNGMISARFAGPVSPRELQSELSKLE